MGLGQSLLWDWRREQEHWGNSLCFSLKLWYYSDTNKKLYYFRSVKFYCRIKHRKESVVPNLNNTEYIRYWGGLKYSYVWFIRRLVGCMKVTQLCGRLMRLYRLCGLDKWQCSIIKYVIMKTAHSTTDCTAKFNQQKSLCVCVSVCMYVCMCVFQSKAQRRQKENDITIRDVVYTSDIMRIRSTVISAAFVWIASLVALINRCPDRILIGGTSWWLWQLSPPIKSCHKTHVCSSIAGGLLLLFFPLCQFFHIAIGW